MGTSYVETLCLIKLTIAVTTWESILTHYLNELKKKFRRRRESNPDASYPGHGAPTITTKPRMTVSFNRRTWMIGLEFSFNRARCQGKLPIISEIEEEDWNFKKVTEKITLCGRTWQQFNINTNSVPNSNWVEDFTPRWTLKTLCQTQETNSVRLCLIGAKLNA